MKRMKMGSRFTEIRKNLFRNKSLCLMLFPPLTVLILFYYLPMYGIQIAFRDYDILKGVWDSPWVGLKHISRFFNNYMFSRVLGNTLLISGYSLFTFPLSLVLALLLNYVPIKWYKKTIQMVSYTPHFLSTVVMCGMVMQFLDARSGLLNLVLGIFGVPAQNYMASAGAYPHIYIWSDVWQNVGYGSIIYIAALSSISPELHEAAIIDGANIWQSIWHIDIPGVLPTFCILLIMRCGGIMNVGYEKTLLLQNSLNTKVSEVISTYVYKQSFNSSFPQYSYSTAIGLFTSLVNMTLLTIVNRISKSLTESSLW